MVCEDTLKVKNLPKELTDEEKKDFMVHFGAQNVKVLTSSAKQKSVVYAKFQSKEIAKNVLLRLHQTKILNNRLCVEYADHEIGQGKPKSSTVQDQDDRRAEFFNNFITKINAFNNSVNYNQPPPAHLKYSYPKANRATINNIAHALATIPKFYTQVLHLMNRMNLPPPFVIEDPSQMPLRHLQEKQRPASSATKASQSSSESELESDSESSSRKDNPIIPEKRTLPQKKTVKRPKFIKPNVAQPHSSTKPPDKTEDVFDKSNLSSQRKIELKVTGESLETKRSQDQEVTSKIGVASHSIVNKEEEIEEMDTETIEPEFKDQVISDKDLAANQIPSKDLGVLPVFKDYHPGAPSCRLYIKNIAKTVDVKHLEYIYNRYKVEGSEDRPAQFDIRLMKEGRMKGQAFVTLDSVELAQKALKETNGFILKEKPLVVVFARSAVPKK